MSRWIWIVIFCLLSGACSEQPLELNLSQVQLKRFANCQDYERLLKRMQTLQDQTRLDEWFGSVPISAPEDADGQSVALGDTNVQVSGVDELDRAKADGDFVFQLHEGILRVIRRNPTSQGALVQSIEVINDIGGSDSCCGFADTSGLHVTANEVVVVGQMAEAVAITVYKRGQDGTLSYAYHRELDGQLSASRLIGRYLHLVIAQPSLIHGDIPVVNQLPQTRYQGQSKLLRQCTDIYYEPALLTSSLSANAMYSADSSLSCVWSINLDAFAEDPSGECVVSGWTSVVYASADHAFVNTQVWAQQAPLHQFVLAKAGSATKYRGTVLIDGQLLNSFSMDEYQGHLRVASTVEFSNGGQAPDERWASRGNEVHVFALGEGNPQQVGSLTGLALGERIYAVRFMGDRGYVVTFQVIDPLFTIDLTDPAQPKLLGELKIPGYSTYLHPLSQNYLLAIGRDVEVTNTGQVGLTQGVALSIFDVSNPKQPQQLHHFSIGDTLTQSEAVFDHKAFRYISDHNLLVLPLSLYAAGSNSWPEEPSFAGFYLLNASEVTGFSLQSQVSVEQQAADPWLLSQGRGRSFYQSGSLALLADDELIVRQSSNWSVDVKRVPLN